MIIIKRRSKVLSRVQSLLFVLCAACSPTHDEPQAGPGSGGAGGTSQVGSGGGGGSIATGSSGSGGGTVIGGTGGTRVVATGGTSGGGGSGGSVADAGMPDAAVIDPPEACDPADMLAPPTKVSDPGTGAKPTGDFEVVVETDQGLDDHTVYRPEPLGAIKHPVIAWANGGCMKDSTGFAELLMQLTSQGFVVIADGTPGGSGSGGLGTDGTVLIEAINWAEKENARPCSQYYRKLDPTKVAVSGQSCGGLTAFGAATDPRITTAVPMNSGLMSRNQQIYDALHAPMAIIGGGTADTLAYQNGLDDFNAVDSIPFLYVNLNVGHGGTYWDDNAGEFGEVAVGWMRWWLLDDQGATGKGMFIGASCGLCSTDWDLMWKMQPQ